MSIGDYLYVGDHHLTYMDPYIEAGIVIFITLGMGVLLVYRMYLDRTHTPTIDTDKILDSIIPRMK